MLVFSLWKARFGITIPPGLQDAVVKVPGSSQIIGIFQRTHVNLAQILYWGIGQLQGLGYDSRGFNGALQRRAVHSVDVLRLEKLGALLRLGYNPSSLLNQKIPLYCHESIAHLCKY